MILVTVITEDGNTYLEPTFINCKCLPTWHAHHQRQLNLINFDLKDKENRIQQLRALEEGIRLLLVRHREYSKMEIKQDQYWLRQDYARTNIVRMLENEDMVRNSPKGKEPEGLKETEKVDPWVDTDTYEYSTSASIYQSDLEKETTPGNDGHGFPESFEQKLLTGAVEQHEGITNEISSEAIIIRTETSSKNPTQSRRLHLGPIIDIEEILNRFNDIRTKAAEYMNQWDEEDTLRSQKYAAIYPKQQDARNYCCCTPEHRLYHRYLDAAFDSGKKLQIEAELQVQIRKSDIQKELQETMTTNRQRDVDFLLQTIENHIPAQIQDIKTAMGVEGRLKALVAYLMKYDGRDDLQAVGEGDRFSAALTMELLSMVDAMVERWGNEDASMEKMVEEVLMGEQRARNMLLKLDE
ncbi:MAG: hypothetical protein Q9225_007335 [Loekoesia sp. 1 TL-2023]